MERAGDDGDLAAVPVDQQRHWQAERLAVPAQGVEGVAARVGVAGERLDADSVEKRAAP